MTETLTYKNMKRTIKAVAKNESQRIQISLSLEMDGLNKGGWDAHQQTKKTKRLKDDIFSLLSNSGYHYDEIKIK